MSTSTYLIMNFKDSDGKERALKITDPVTDLSLETVQDVADLITTHNVLVTQSGASYETFLSAQYKTVTIEDLVAENAE